MHENSSGLFVRCHVAVYSEDSLIVRTDVVEAVLVITRTVNVGTCALVFARLTELSDVVGGAAVAYNLLVGGW